MEATAIVELGLTSAEFWELTPREYDHLVKAFHRRERRVDRRFGLVAAFIVNYAGKSLDSEKHPEPFSIDEALGLKRSEPTIEELRQQLDLGVAAERYLSKLQAADPTSQITYSRAVIESIARGRGTWGKLGTREGLTESAAVQEAIRRSTR